MALFFGLLVGELTCRGDGVGRRGGPLWPPVVPVGRRSGRPRGAAPTGWDRARGIPRGEALEEARRVAAEVARGSVSAHETLSSLYEDLLRYWPIVDAARGGFCLERSNTGRKASGSFYTPGWVARSLVGAALDPLIQRGGPGASFLPRVLDPTMGTGVFLLQVVRYLVARCADRRGLDVSVVAERCLYGIDCDPLAVELTIASLWLETGARPAILARHLRCGNLLGEEEPPRFGRFDAVVGNPPWGAHYSSAERKPLTRRFPGSTRGSFDSFKLFLDLASALSHGTVGMVVPQAVLAQATHADIREVLLDRLDPYWAVNLGDGVFLGAAAPACALVFGPKPGPRFVQCVGVPARHWSAERGFMLARTELVDLLHRLQRRHGTIGEVAHLYRVRDVGINYNRASVARRVLYAGTEGEHPEDVRRYRGRDFDRYTSIGTSGWLRHDAQRLLGPGETISLDWSTYSLAEKVVFRQTADRIVATLDRSRMVMGRSVIAITREGDVSLRALLACLNSRLLTVLYRSLAGEEGRVLPQVKVGRIKALPLPDVCSLPVSNGACLPGDDLDDRALVWQLERDPRSAWAYLDRLADVLLQAAGRDPRADALVDRIVYRLYGLTPEEIALVEAA